MDSPSFSPEDALEENRRLKRAMRDLVALSALPAVWIGLGPEAIAQSLADALQRILSLDLIYIRLSEGGMVVDAFRGRGRGSIESVRTVVEPLLRPQTEPTETIPSPFGPHVLRAAVTRFGTGLDEGVVVTASRAADYPSDLDRLLVGVGANQTGMILQRRRAEEQVHERGEWLRVTLASIGDGVIATDTRGAVTFMNPVAEDLSGWGASEAVGEPIETVFPLLHEDSRRTADSPVVKVLECQTSTRGELAILVARDQSQRVIEHAAAPIRDAEESLIGVVLTFRDVTGNRQAARQVRESEARKSAILDTALDCIIAMDHEGKVVEFNPAAERTFAYRRKDILGRSLAECIIPPRLRESHHRGLARYLATGDGPLIGRRVEVMGMRADGTEIPVELAVTRIDSDGSPLFTAYLRDISERARVEHLRSLRLRVTQVLAQTRSLNEAASALLEAVCTTLEWDVGLFWIVDSGGETLRCLESWHHPKVTITAFEAASRDRTFRRGDGLPGRVWQSAEPAWLLDAAAAADFPRAAAAASEGLHGAFACPLVVGPDVLGVIEFFSQAIRQPDPGLLETMATVSGLVAQLVERSQAEEALKESEERFRGLMEQAPFSIQVFTPDGRTVRVNKAWEDLWGVRLDQIGDYNVLDDPQLEARGVMPFIRRGFAGEATRIPPIEYNPNETIPGITELEDPRRWLSAVIYPLADAAGRVREVVLIHEDITSRWLAEAELRLRLDELAEANRRREELVASLRESEEKFRLLAETIPQLAWMAHPDGTVFWFNRRWYEYTGTTPERMADGGWHSIHDPKTLPDVLARWNQSLATGEPFDMVFPLRGADGRFRPFLTRVNPLRDREGRVLQWFGTNTDISELKRMEEALRENDRRKDEFLATLAHELRNPLAPIRNSLQILKMPEVGEATLRQTRDTMERQVDHLVRLVDDLLDVSRVMRGKIDLRRERVDLAVVVARAVETAQPLVDAQGHELEIALPREPLVSSADPIRLTQVIANLLTNAAKYSEPRGHIGVSLRREGDEAVVSVRDTGIGIPPEVLPHIFELFVQADHGSARAQGGLGIGLTLAKSLVELHGGRVEAHSEGPGQGSEVVVRLPLTPAEALSKPREARPAPTESLRGHRLLVVDDNQDAALTLATLLELQGHEVRVAHSGQAALEVAVEFGPAMVFLDIGMPGMDGYEVARRLRALPDVEGTVLVALTGWGQPEDRRRTAEAGFDHHLVKPPDLGAVERLVASIRAEKD